MPFTVDSTIGDLLNNPQVAVLIDKYTNGASKNPQLALVRSLSIRSVLSMPQAQQMGLTQEMVEKFLKEANALIGK
jgi:hypothetical protein